MLLSNAGLAGAGCATHAQEPARFPRQAWAGRRVAMNIASERLALNGSSAATWLPALGRAARRLRGSTSASACCLTRDFTHWTQCAPLGTGHLGAYFLGGGWAWPPPSPQLVLNGMIQTSRDRLVLRRPVEQTHPRRRRAGARRRADAATDERRHVSFRRFRWKPGGAADLMAW